MKKYLPIVILIAVILLILNWLYMPFEDKSDYRTSYSITVTSTPSPTPSPSLRVMTEEDVLKGMQYGEVVWATYGHESSYGKHDPCRAKGLYNGFGFGHQGNNVYPCFKSLEEVGTKVSEWFTKKLEKYTIRQALCLYQSGVASNDCPYASTTMQMMGGHK